MTYAEAEQIAREAAHALPPCDHASVRAIGSVASLLVEAYRRGAADQRADTRRRLFPAPLTAPSAP